MKDYYDGYWEKKIIPKDHNYKVSLIKKFVPRGFNLNVLDFGCGKEIITQDILAINTSLKITGVDVSKIAIAYARKKMPGQKFYTIAEGKKLPFKDKTFDFIFALDVMLCVYDTELIFKELSRVLKPRGRLLIALRYYGLLKNIPIALIGYEKVYNPRDAAIRFYTKKSLMNEIKEVGVYPLAFGYFGRFYTFSRGMHALCTK